MNKGCIVKFATTTKNYFNHENMDNVDQIKVIRVSLWIEIP